MLQSSKTKIPHVLPNTVQFLIHHGFSLSGATNVSRIAEPARITALIPTARRDRTLLEAL